MLKYYRIAKVNIMAGDATFPKQDNGDDCTGQTGTCLPG